MRANKKVKKEQCTKKRRVEARRGYPDETEDGTTGQGKSCPLAQHWARGARTTRKKKKLRVRCRLAPIAAAPVKRRAASPASSPCSSAEPDAAVRPCAPVAHLDLFGHGQATWHRVCNAAGDIRAGSPVVLPSHGAVSRLSTPRGYCWGAGEIGQGLLQGWCAMSSPLSCALCTLMCAPRSPLCERA